jgi:hypothetical protein
VPTVAATSDWYNYIAMADSTSSSSSAPVVIKKYDERYYDTERNGYVTLNELGSRVKQRQEFTVVDARTGEDLTRWALEQISFQDDMAHSMRTLIREGTLPHDLLDHHWFRGPIKEIGPHEIILPGGCDYFPVDDIKVVNELPPTLARKDYDVSRVEARFQLFNESLHEKNQAQIAAGKPGIDVENILKNRPGSPSQIDDITCYVMGTWLEKMNHKKIIDAVLKPLGYARPKGEKGDSYLKRLSETDFLTCSFDMHALWGRARELRASAGYRRGEKEVFVPLVYWGAFNWIEWMKIENMNPMMITTQRIFTMAIENIGFLLTMLETSCLERMRNAVNG